MNNLHYRRLFLFAVMVLLVMTTVGSVLADKPAKFVVPRDIFIEERLNCGDFIASEHLVDTLRVTEFYDTDADIPHPNICFRLFNFFACLHPLFRERNVIHLISVECGGDCVEKLARITQHQCLRNVHILLRTQLLRRNN